MLAREQMFVNKDNSSLSEFGRVKTNFHVTMSSVRLREKIYLLGYYSHDITGSKLPSNKQVLSVLFFNIRVVKLTLRENARLALQEVMVFWEKARIPTQEIRNCIPKLEALYQEWRQLQKNARRSREADKKKEADFKLKLEDLFDIAHANALDLITIEEDKQFLINQRLKGRPGFMYGIDYEELEKERRAAEREETALARKKRSDRETEQLKQTAQLMSSTSSSSLESGINVVPVAGKSTDNIVVEHPLPEDMEVVSPEAKRKRGRHKVMTTKLAAALDKCRISDRDAVHILIATTEALGHDVQDFVINRSSIHISREKIREERAAEIKKHFKDAKLQAAVVHWDGKLLPTLTGKETVDRLPVILSNGDTEQLLRVPGLQSGTGKQQASAVCETLAKWGLQNYVKALVFDTTATNTGRFSGACILIENFLEKDLLYLPCRHHIYEIILRSVFEEKMGKTTGPNVLIFKRFQNAWSGINVHNFRSGIENEKVKGHLNQGDVTRILDFVRNTLREQQPREDYREFLELTAIFLGEAPPRGISFRVPGAIHHARWMAKAIYCLKIFLFRGEFVLSLQEENAICDICIFLVSMYVEAWFCAPSAAKAPYLDFRVLSKLFEYQAIDRGISRVALQKLSNHLWYLSPEVVALAFFDTNLSFESKIKMVNALNRETESLNKNKKRIKVQIDKIPKIVNNGIEQFVSTETRGFFKRFDLNDEFLKTEPLTWHKNESFVKGLELVNKWRVVNDSAERGVKLMEDYNKLFTKNEQQKQYVLQIVSDYRRKFPGYKKETLSQRRDL